MPFTVVYLFDGQGDARLSVTTGLRAGQAAAPELIEGADPAAVWPAAEILDGDQDGIVIDGIASRGCPPANGRCHPSKRSR